MVDQGVSATAHYNNKRGNCMTNKALLTTREAAKELFGTDSDHFRRVVRNMCKKKQIEFISVGEKRPQFFIPVSAIKRWQPDQTYPK